MTVTR
jgi:hypothetical protein